MALVSALLCGGLGMVALPLPLKPAVAVEKMLLQRVQFAHVATSAPLARRSMALSLIAPAASAFFGVQLGQELDPAAVSLAIAAVSGFGISTAYARRERCFHSLAQLREASAGVHQAVKASASARESAAVDAAIHKVWASFTHDIQICDDLEYNQLERERAEARLFLDLRALSSLLDAFRSPPATQPKAPSPAAKPSHAPPSTTGAPARRAAVLAGEERRSAVLAVEERRLAASVRRVRALASTPSSPFLLRASTVGAATLYPLLMGPHFAAAAAAAMDCGGGGLWPAALAAVGFAFSNAGFVAIQEALADPLCRPSALGITISDFDPPGYDEYLCTCVGKLRENTKALVKEAKAAKALEKGMKAAATGKGPAAP